MSFAGLQMLRAFAAWLVVLHHYHQLIHGFDKSTLVGRLLVEAGPYGVDVFFVISGFIMHSSLTGREQRPADFLMRRVDRIVPAYWLATVVFAVCVAVLGRAEDRWTQWDAQRLILSALFIPHKHLSSMGQYPVLTVGWSLNFEMFFYTFLTLMLVLAGRFWMWAVALLLVALPWIWPVNAPWAAVLASPLLLFFVAGLLISRCLQWMQARGTAGSPSWRLELLFAVLVSIWTFAYIGFKPLPLLWRFDFPLRLLTAVAAVVMVIRCECWLAGRPSLGWLVRLGDASYSTYLVHPIVLVLMLALPWVVVGPDLQPLALLAYVAGTLGLSLVFHRYVESRRWFTRSLTARGANV